MCLQWGHAVSIGLVAAERTGRSRHCAKMMLLLARAAVLSEDAHKTALTRGLLAAMTVCSPRQAALDVVSPRQSPKRKYHASMVQSAAATTDAALAARHCCLLRSSSMRSERTVEQYSSQLRWKAPRTWPQKLLDSTRQRQS